jgi:ADP-heptose:LPS heptosyltransferase
LSFKTKVLIIRFSSIGDILLTTPVVRCLKEQLEGEVEVHYLVKKEYQGLLELNPHIDVIHVYDKNLKALSAGLEKEGFHYIIDLHKNMRSKMVKRHLTGMHFSFRKLNIEKWILVNVGIDRLPDLHIVDRYFEAVKALGVKNDGKGLEYFIPESEEVNTMKLLGHEQGRYVVFAIGAAHEGKRLPLHKMTELCHLINRPVVLIGGKEDALDGHAIASVNKNVTNLCGKTNIHGSASIIKQASLVICHDSGMMHVAAAFKKKIISIWGATVPKFGMYPYLPDPDSVIVEAGHLSFRPTSKLGNKNSKKEQRTTEEIELKRIVAAVEKLMKD